jgi:hypothetical protein
MVLGVVEMRLPSNCKSPIIGSYFLTIKNSPKFILELLD